MIQIRGWGKIRKVRNERLKEVRENQGKELVSGTICC